MTTAKRLHPLPWLFLLGAVGFVPSCGTKSQDIDRILLVTIDTMRWDRLGAAGSRVATPNLDALAEKGALFTQAVTTAPITLVSHSSIFTGVYPPSHGVRNNGTFRLSDEAETLAERLGEQGFATAAFVGALVLDSRHGLDQGFDLYDDELPEENPLSKAYFPERRADAVIDRAVEWIASRENQKQFVWVHLFDPHAPYDPPSPFAERYPDSGYDGEIAYTDSELGRLFEAFERGHESSSAIIVTSDHGESLGEHGESTHTFFIYDSTMRVPLVVQAPGIEPGSRVDAQVRTVDIYPTILEWASAEPRGAIDGESLYVHLDDARSPEKRLAYGESFAARLSFKWSPLRFLRSDTHKLIEAPRPELYDLEDDPVESRNLWDADSPPRLARQLASELQDIKSRESDAIDPTLEIDDETARRLESLGYLASSESIDFGAEEGLPDPKDRIAEFEKLQIILSSDLSPDELIAAYREILEAEPTNNTARSRLAAVLSEEQRYEEAVIEYHELIRNSDKAGEGLENLAAVLLLMGRVEEALDVTEAGIVEIPWDVEIQVLRGESLEEADRLGEALAFYDQAIEIQPEKAVHHWRRGEAAEKLGQLDEAETRFRDALERDPAFEPAVSALARLLTEVGRSEEALAVLGAGAEEETPELKAARAQALLASGNFERAKTLLESAHAEAPEHTRVLALLGPLYGREGNLARAQALLEKAFELGEQSPDVRRNLALVYLQQNRTGDAIAQLERACADAPEDEGLWFTLGNARLRARRSADAVAALERAVSLRVDWPEAWFNLGLAAEQAGRGDRAADAYQRFLSLGAGEDTRRAEAQKRLERLR